MLEFFKTNPAIALVKEDHDRVKGLFDDFEQAKTRASKRKIVRAALTELKIHAAIEEELFYPAVRKAVGKEIMNEADEEHHVAKLLIAELDSMDGSESHFDAKFQVLAENVRHHIKEEENEMLPKTKGLKLDFDALADAMKRRKERLLTSGVPAVGEEAMVKASRGRGDSPAQAAKRKPPKVATRKKT
ncbi:MAG: hemerythrin domain-containing protein [Planctomycetaceae bacterium]